MNKKRKPEVDLLPVCIDYSVTSGPGYEFFSPGGIFSIEYFYLTTNLLTNLC